MVILVIHLQAVIQFLLYLLYQFMMIPAIPLHVDRMQTVIMVYVPVYQNIMVIRILDAVQNVYLIRIVR